jgi:hypothetical protein
MTLYNGKINYLNIDDEGNFDRLGRGVQFGWVMSGFGVPYSTLPSPSISQRTKNRNFPLN